MKYWKKYKSEMKLYGSGVKFYKSDVYFEFEISLTYF